MLQAIVKKGIVIEEKVPAPVVSSGSVLIKVVNSCISAGTELSGMLTSGQPLIKRALEQPEKVKKVINMVRSDGISAAFKNVKGELEKGKPTGYSLSGVVIGIGKDVNGLKLGDRVAAAGGGLANHAEYVDIPLNLVVKIPSEVDYLSGSTVALGAIAMHGIRRSNLQFGEFGVVFGAGIIGLLTQQMLKYAGIRVAVVDIDNNRLQIAKDLGAELTLNPEEDKPVSIVIDWSDGHGVDAVIFTASTTSSIPLSQSFQMCKRKGKVILVGVSGMEINRKDMYSRELDLIVSTSYGPGRYDRNYEEKNFEYPYAYIRWTEKRNMSEYLRLIKEQAVQLEPLITDTYPIQRVTDAFNALKSSDQKPLMVILDYGEPDPTKYEEYANHERKVYLEKRSVEKSMINVALVGAGNFANNIHLPNLKKMNEKYALYAICDQNGYKGKYAAERYQAKYTTSNYDEILEDKNVDLVMICTRHDSHADLTLKGLESGKHVFVEKPLATNQITLDKIKTYFSKSGQTKPVLMVGFNRRFSPYVQEIKKHTDHRINPLFIHYRMNAGFVPLDHWVHENGGRMVGEACHIIDLMTFFTGSRIATINFESLSPNTGSISASDNKSIVLKYKDGSLATIEYLAVGNKNFPKEYMEVHFDEKTLVLNDYKSLKGYGLKLNEMSSNKSEKGHVEELQALFDSLTGKNANWPIELWDIFETTETTLLIK